VQVIHGRQIIGYGNSTNSGLLTSFFVGPLSIRVISVIRGQDFGCGGAALGNPRFSLELTPIEDDFAGIAGSHELDGYAIYVADCSCSTAAM
jgi:hypothetical protein